MIVISSPDPTVNEINHIHSLFDEGMELFHVRKPDSTEEEIKTFLSNIKPEHRNSLVLHQHHQLAESFGINRIHFSRKDRNNSLSLWNPEKINSTSVHCISYFNDLKLKTIHNFDYAFLSPIYPSISKPDYTSTKNLLETVKQRTNFSTKLVALGGVAPENIREALEYGFDDVAILGTIWNSGNPIENFKRCQQIVLSHSL